MLQEIKDAIENFKNVQHKYRHFGAHDSEPDAVFQDSLFNAFNERKFTPLSTHDWDLYTSIYDCTQTANELNETTQIVCDLVQNNKTTEIAHFLQDFCWRLRENWDL